MFDDDKHALGRVFIFKHLHIKNVAPYFNIGVGWNMDLAYAWRCCSLHLSIFLIFFISPQIHRIGHSLLAPGKIIHKMADDDVHTTRYKKYKPLVKLFCTTITHMKYCLFLCLPAGPAGGLCSAGFSWKYVCLSDITPTRPFAAI